MSTPWTKESKKRKMMIKTDNDESTAAVKDLILIGCVLSWSTTCFLGKKIPYGLFLSFPKMHLKRKDRSRKMVLLLPCYICVVCVKKWTIKGTIKSWFFDLFVWESTSGISSFFSSLFFLNETTSLSSYFFLVAFPVSSQNRQGSNNYLLHRK